MWDNCGKRRWEREGDKGEEEGRAGDDGMGLKGGLIVGSKVDEGKSERDGRR